jgi:hypothetical protein
MFSGAGRFVMVLPSGSAASARKSVRTVQGGDPEGTRDQEHLYAIWRSSPLVSHTLGSSFANLQNSYRGSMADFDK